MKKLVILCVDDERMVLDSLKTELRAAIGDRFTIEIAENGEEGLEIFADLLGDDIEVPIVISDYIMPVMKGDEFLIKIHKSSPECIKILLTGEAHLDGITNAVNNANLYRYITKPWATKDLVLTVEEGIKSYYKDKRLLEQNLQLNNMNITLEKKVREIRQKNESIRASINYAKRIQTALLPQHDKIAKAFPEHFIFYKPKDVVSGDLYWFCQTEEQDAFIAAIDCTGHGVPGAFMSVIANNLLNQIILDRAIYTPNEILNELNKGVKWVLKQDDNNNRDGMDIALCRLLAGKKSLQYAGAMNNLYYFQDNVFYELQATRCSIGDSLMQMPDSGCVLYEILLDKPTTFYLFTDGYRDQLGGNSRTKFMSKRFKDMIIAMQEQTIEEQGQNVENCLDNWTDHWNTKQVDDVLVMGFKV